MRLSAPSQMFFIISVVLAVAVLLVRYAGINIPVVSEHTTLAMLIAYLVLLTGVMLPGV